MFAMLKLALVVLAVTPILGQPNSRERRFDWPEWVPRWVSNAAGAVSDFAGNVKDRVTSWFDGPVQQEAEAVLSEKDRVVEEGNALVKRGEYLLDLASQLSNKLYDEATDPENHQKVKDAIDALKQAASDTIDTGRTIIANSDNITAALGDSFSDLGDIVKTSVGDVGKMVKKAGDSMGVAGKKIIKAAGSAKDSAVSLAGAMKEVIKTSDLIAQAGRAVNAVGDRVVDLGRRLLQAGMDVGKVLADAARNVAKASGITGK